MPLSDRYELGRALGRGTFGTTFLGREIETGRAVTIKRLPLRGLSEWRPVELFEREARVLRSLEHPGVPSFIEAQEDEDAEEGPCFYIVFEHVEGPTLHSEIARGRRWSPAQARELLRGLLQTLDYLHSLSPRVIHRDIKPGNVVLRHGNEPVLVDFGSVRDVVARQPDGGMTIAGTAGYMAPEQAMGIADVRSDLYGVGATMAHGLTHVHPSELPREGLRPRLSDLAGMDPALSSILERLLEPEPARRFGSAAEVLRAIDAPSMSEALAPGRDATASTALARREDDGETMLARLAEGPREVGPEIEKRLDYNRAMRTGMATGMGVLLGGMSAGVALAVAGLPFVTIPFIFASLGGFFLVPLVKRKKLRALYAHGAVTQGRILQARSEAGSLFVRYRFGHEGRDYEGMLLCNDPFVINRVDPDTPVHVFYDPLRPARNAGLLPDELPELRKTRSKDAPE